ncbi:MAG: chemoreceptor glutamine deamidase CheD [Pseudomonadales bacterium]|nr:chemoreceptor glutamine deamidase CheD [Pseudomonadales bacterium]
MSALSQPPAQDLLPGFGHVRRYRDPQDGGACARILPGEYYVGRAGERVVTVLGSCVSACLRDATAGVGGMNHFMLPESDGSPVWGDALSAATRYGSHAMERLINDVLRAGGRRERLEAKLVGGGHVLQIETEIGAANVAFARRYLRTERITLLAEDVGGVRGRRVVYDIGTGRVRVKPVVDALALLGQEQGYRSELAQQPLDGGVELFT